MSSKIILGIDPGTNIMGYGLILVNGKNMSLLDFGEINMSKIKDHALKLDKVYKSVINIIEVHKPDEIAIEAPFFGKNVQSMLKLGRAQGVAMAAGISRQIPIKEYSPKKIKMAITGNGNSSKDQVAKMLQSILKFKKLPKKLDSTDGLAAAVCHFYNQNNLLINDKYSGWNSFLKNNPDRLKN
tara:strand:+ start:5374 stop:5925 length:552 start_codon:yes stop_codon:yes gene_type:complete